MQTDNHNNEGELREKPPLGVMPAYYYERYRIQDLARAIHEYAGRCIHVEMLEVWAKELVSRIEKWNQMKNDLADKQEGKVEEIIIRELVKDSILSGKSLPETVAFFQNNNDLFQELSPWGEGIVDGIFRGIKAAKTFLRK